MRLATLEEIDLVARRLTRINPGARQIKVCRGAIAAQEVLGCALYDPAARTADVRRWLAEEGVAGAQATDQPQHAYDASRHDGSIDAFVLHFEQPFAWPEFAEAIDLLLSTCGERILRVKGLVDVEGEIAPCVIDCVQHVRYPATVLPEWPDEDHRSRLVFIVQALAREVVAKAFFMFCGTAAGKDGD